MTEMTISRLRAATPDDARELAKLIDIAGEGIPTWLWAQSTRAGQTPLDVGVARAERTTGGFSYSNALVAHDTRGVLGMVLSYAITEALEEDVEGLAAPIAPFVELEADSVGSWYVNALAVFPQHRGKGLGARMMQAAERSASDAGQKQMTIQVFEQNLGAVRLYRLLGYSERGRSPVRLHPCQPYYTGDVLLLTKTL